MCKASMDTETIDVILRIKLDQTLTLPPLPRIACIPNPSASVTVKIQFPINVAQNILT